MPAFRVTDMTCEGCVRALTAAVKDVDAGATLQADLQSKQVTVASTATPDALAGAMREAGFTVEAA
ncbi:MAG: heavy-metal-associated domain-containing protein [Rhodospirillales bacterium]|nr:heavy-metal-associated domain-containing protein [Rhodospirillales bacterium]MBN8902543.1 heavy-metal-associated domain-containing protein [Rhodospirillales bacterium]